MPGANCSIFGCSTSRRNKQISIFKIPKAKDENSRQWRESLLQVIKKDRVVCPDLKRQIAEDRVHICEKHFSHDQLYYYETKKEMKEGVIPLLNLPEKSIKTLKILPRSTDSISKRIAVLPVKKDCVKRYKNFDEFKQRTLKLKLHPSWSIHETLLELVIINKEPNYVIPKFEIFIDISLAFTIRVYGWMLNEDHYLYKKYKRTLYNITLTEMLCKINQMKLCEGMKSVDDKHLPYVKQHIVPEVFDYASYMGLDSQPKYAQLEYLRSSDCDILLCKDLQCNSCKQRCLQLVSECKKKLQTATMPAKLKAPITFTSPERIILTMQNQRLKCKQLEKQIAAMKVEREKSATNISNDLEKDLVSLYSDCDEKKIPPFMKLFWAQQQKYVNSSRSGVRYHPMIIKFCLSLAAKSSSAYSDLRYDEKRGTGILVLPSLRTLRDYRNYIRPTRGFNAATVNELLEKTKLFTPEEKYISILLDEMKIQEDLVWDKNNGELIGFVDLGDTEINYGTLKNVEELASHVLVFLIKSIINPLSYSFATFATTGCSSFQIFPLFWKAVAMLEGTCKLKVIAATADGASPNRTFFRMHKFLDNDPAKGVIYRSINMYADDDEDRYIYFFADAPHLMKTARNCLSNSGAGRSTRYMWNNDNYILWNHITDIYYENVSCGLKLLPKLTSEHVNINQFSTMNVRLAVQVLSSSVADVLSEFGPPDAIETSQLCRLMDKFFDCMNVRNTKEHILKLKPSLKPFTSVNDERFIWLEDVFLDYFFKWKNSIENRPGNFTANARKNMFLSWQTFEGLQISVYSLIEVVKYLLNQNVSYVLSEKFCQDDLENYFGRQRSIGRRRDNPTLRDVGYNDNLIKSQFSVRPISGNVRPGESKWNDIDEEPLKKRKKQI